MDHPSVEVRFPFDGGHHRLEVPCDTTHFYWGAIGFGTADESPSSIQKPGQITQSISDRVSCSLSIDGESKPLLRNVRHHNGQHQRAFWTATDPPTLPVTATVTLHADGDAPMYDGKQVALWTHSDEVVPWTETVQTELQLVSSSNTQSMRTDGLWGQHDVYIPEEVAVSE